jgi:NADH dehydrogenase
LRGLRFGGWPAWLAWALIHLFFLVGFRNRVLVFLQWGWAYVFYTRGARIISEIPARRTDGGAPRSVA